MQTFLAPVIKADSRHDASVWPPHRVPGWSRAGIRLPGSPLNPLDLAGHGLKRLTWGSMVIHGLPAAQSAASSGGALSVSDLSINN